MKKSYFVIMRNYMKKLISLISTKGKTKEQIKEEAKQALKRFIEKATKKNGQITRFLFLKYPSPFCFW